jgi:hypothetical protein
MKILSNIQYLLNPISKHYETNMVHPSILDEGFANNSTKREHGTRCGGWGEILADKQTTFLHK